MGFRLYLGGDATTDFDIVRNTSYTVTVSIGDRATGKLSWKVVPGTVDDKRTLSWARNPDTLLCERTLTVTPELNYGDTELDFAIEGADTLGVTYTRSGNTLTFTSARQLSGARTFSVTASTADARHSAKLAVVVQPRYPVSLEASCPGCGGTGEWAWDFYKKGAGTAVAYSVTAVYNDGLRRTLSTSEYAVSGNTRTDLVDFSTNGSVRNVGSVDDGGDGTVDFSYSGDGRTVTLRKKWWKVYVTAIRPSVTSKYETFETAGSQSGKAVSGVLYGETAEVKAYLDYNYGGETVTWPDALGDLNLADSSLIVCSGHSVTGKRYGSTSVQSDGTFRGRQLSGTIKSWRHCTLSKTPSGTFDPAAANPLHYQNIDSAATYYCVSVDADGMHQESGGTIHCTHGLTRDFTGSATGAQLVEGLVEINSWSIYCGSDVSSCPFKYWDYGRVLLLDDTWGKCGGIWMRFPGY